MISRANRINRKYILLYSSESFETLSTTIIVTTEIDGIHGICEQQF